MARYIKEYQLSTNPEAALMRIHDYLQNEGYTFIVYDGENVYKRGKGVFEAPTFFKFSYINNSVRMETWMKYTILPGVFVGEIDVKSFIGIAAKGQWKRRLSYIETVFENFEAQPNYAPPQQNNSNVGFSAPPRQFASENDFEETCILNENNERMPSPAFCKNCGTRILDGDAFCSNCGQAYVPDGNQTANAPVSSTPNVYNHASGDGFNNSVSAPLPNTRSNISQKEFINQYAPSLKREITIAACLCYFCAAATIISSFVNGLYIYGLYGYADIITGLIMLGLGLGMHLAKSKACAIGVLVLSIPVTILTIIGGGFPFWWLLAGILSTVLFSKANKQYKQFISSNS